MKLRVKREHTAYLFDRRWREGQVVDVPEKLLKKADQAFIDKLEAQRAKELGPSEAKKHGLKVGSVILPKWAELPSQPVKPAPGIPGMKPAGSAIPARASASAAAAEEGADEGQEAAAAGAEGQQNVL